MIIGLSKRLTQELGKGFSHGRITANYYPFLMTRLEVFMKKKPRTQSGQFVECLGYLALVLVAISFLIIFSPELNN